MLHAPLRLQWPNQESYAFLFEIDASTKRCTHIVAWHVKNKGWYNWIPRRLYNVQCLILFSNAKLKKPFRCESFFLSSVINVNVLSFDNLPFPNMLKNIVMSYSSCRKTSASVIIPTNETFFLVNHLCRLRWQGTSQYSHVKISIYKDTWDVLFDWQPNKHWEIWKPLEEGTFRLLFEFKSQDLDDYNWIESQQFVCRDTEKDYDYEMKSMCDYFDFGLEEQIYNLCNNVFGPGKKLDVDYMQGGGYNSIAKIKDNSTQAEYILRMPKSKMKHINFMNQIFQSLYLSSVFPPHFIPKLIAFDARCHNAIGNQYTIETKLQGTCLSHVFEAELQFHQRCYLAREVAHFLIHTFSVQQEFCGPVVAPLPFSDSKMRIGRKYWRKEASVASFYYETFDPNHPLPRTLREYLEFRLRDLAIVSKHNLYSAFFELVKNDFPSMGPSFNCLTHLDFFKRNILVSMQDDQMPKVSGVCDWDDCEFLPKELAFLCVPKWLWEEEPSEERLFTSSNLDDNSLSEQNTRIREIFIDTMQTKFSDYKQVITTMNQHPTLIDVARLAYFGDHLCSDSVRFVSELVKQLPKDFLFKTQFENVNIFQDVQKTKNLYRLLDFEIHFTQQRRKKKKKKIKSFFF